MVGLAVRLQTLGVEVRVCADLLLIEADRPTAGARLRLDADRPARMPVSA
ncbi:MAG TPA: hypothetical protein VGH30_01265 [Jatrophihabitantaceae bacterium]|jgi:hypothetical protein